MLKEWESYYLMMGSSGGALIGLLFVVVTLTADFERSQALRGASLYMTPTALDFAAVLSISGVALAPGLPPAARGAIVGLIALVGLAASIRSCVGISRPLPGSLGAHWSDIWTYGVTPAVIYAALLVAAAGLCAEAAWDAYLMAALVMILLLVGIRNAWDLITWIAPKAPEDEKKAQATDSAL